MSETLQEIRVPDIGGFHDVAVIQILVSAGDVVKAEEPILTLESEKATIDVPAPINGKVHHIAVAVGDKVSEGTLVMMLDSGDRTPASSELSKKKALNPQTTSRDDLKPEPSEIESVSVSSNATPSERVLRSNPTLEVPSASRRIHAGPSVRGLAGRLGIDLGEVQGSGPRGRITPDDVKRQIKDHKIEAPPVLAHAPKAAAAPAPSFDFSVFGEIERQPLSRIQRISGARLTNSWSQIPHVTNFDEADITELETFRNHINQEAVPERPKLSVLPFLLKACSIALKKHERFNASLAGSEFVLKKYCHIGFAADTPDGLFVPIIRDVDKKGIIELAREAAELATKARERKLKPSEMEGGSFTISSLGGLRGTGFTPIINAPEVAILGVSKATIQPVWDGAQFMPRKMLPLALSWDHRLVDGVAASRFLGDLVALLQEIRLSLL